MATKVFQKTALLVATLLLLSFACKKTNEAVQEQAVESDTTAVLEEPQSEVGKRVDEFQEKAESLLQQLTEKEQEMAQREAELDSVEQALQQEKAELVTSQQSVKTLRTVSYIIILLGVVLLVVAIIIFRLRKGTKPIEEKAKEKTEKGEKKGSEKSAKAKPEAE